MKIKIIIISAIFCLGVLAISIFKVPMYISFAIESVSSFHISDKKITNEYNENKPLFYELAKYIQDKDEDLTIDRDRDKKFIIERIEDSGNYLVVLDNEKLSNQIKRFLYTLNFKSVVEIGNAIYFLRKTDIGFEQGITFSKDGRKPDWPLINVLEPIAKDWYYYESR